MQSKNILFLIAFATIITLAFGVRMLNRNSVFAAENFVKKAEEKMEDILEKQKLALRATNQKKAKSKNEKFFVIKLLLVIL